uniref:Putative secreted protein n=1 Tax=Ixodes ricinus TaxID=34613 RepID=A0A6B0UJN4_IXORI
MDDLVLHCHPLYKENILLLCCLMLLLNVCWSLLGDVSAAIFVYKGMTKKRLLFDVLCNDCSYFVTAIMLLSPSELCTSPLRHKTFLSSVSVFRCLGGPTIFLWTYALRTNE